MLLLYRPRFTPTKGSARFCFFRSEEPCQIGCTDREDKYQPQPDYASHALNHRGSVSGQSGSGAGMSRASMGAVVRPAPHKASLCCHSEWGCLVSSKHGTEPIQI